MEDKRGASEESGGFWHKAVSLAAAITFSSGAKATLYKFRSTHPRTKTRIARSRVRIRRDGVVHVPIAVPLWIGGGGGSNWLSLSSRPRWSVYAGCYVPPDSVYSSYVAGRFKPGGTPHSGEVSLEDYWSPNITDVNFVPKDMADVYKKTPCATRPPSHSFEELLQKAEDRRDDYRRKVDEQRKRIKEARQAEGLDEVALFRYYFESIGMDKEDYHISSLKIDNQTIASYVLFKDHPNLVIEWHDPDLMEANSQRIGRRGFCSNYKEKVRGFCNNGKTVYGITETDGNRIVPKLEAIASQYSMRENPS